VTAAGRPGLPPSDLDLAVDLLKIVEAWNKAGIPLSSSRDALLLASCSIAQMQRMRRRELLKAAQSAFGRVKDAEKRGQEDQAEEKRIIVPGSLAYS
jgi:uncharacterized protein with von Willebrand factor type A (vWA) domain